MLNILYAIAFAAVCGYLALVILRRSAQRRTRRPGLVERLAPYHGGWFPRSTPPSAEKTDVVTLPPVRDNVLPLDTYSRKVG